jgi:hypothetical protein
VKQRRRDGERKVAGTTVEPMRQTSEVVLTKL